MVLEHEAALTTPYRKWLVRGLKHHFAYTLPKDVAGLFSVYCVNYDPKTGKPREAVLYYVVKDNMEKREAKERLKSSFKTHEGVADFRAFIILKRTEKSGIRMWEAKITKSGKVRACVG